LTPLRIHPFKKDELPTLTFYADVSNEEMVFLTLILAYADLKLPPQEKPPVQYSPAFDILLIDCFPRALVKRLATQLLQWPGMQLFMGYRPAAAFNEFYVDRG
jgi:hypothetical protein